MRRLEAFSGVPVLTYGLMANHFHLLCEVPQTQRVLCPMDGMPGRTFGDRAPIG
jgi:REP element-mobilizing transposase RayT